VPGIDELLTTHSRLPALFEGCGDAIALYRLDGTIAAGNRAALDMVGATGEQLLNAHFQTHVSGSEAQRIAHFFAEAATGGEPEFETAFMHREGHEITVWARLLPARVEGEIVGVYGYARDVTAPKQIEAAFSRSQSQFRSLFEHHPESITSISLDGRYIRVNTAAETLFGYRSEELIGRPVSMVIAPDKRDSTAHVFREIRAARAVNYESELIRKDGTRVTISGTAIPQIIDGVVVGLYALSRDVTAERIEEARRDALAYNDPLTGVANRSIFMDRLDRAVATSRRLNRMFAVHYLDIDHFKSINDTYGHATGDLILCEVARRLGATVRDADTIARLGGDEFVVLQPNPLSRQNVGNLAKRLLGAFALPFATEHGELTVGISIGIALHPNDGTTPAELLEYADRALYAAKHAGRGTYRFFNVASLERAASVKAETGVGLRAAARR
jgi:diguanylate cyclase (GGDEF)-like protein/PAS domain S-box-containing protein